MKNNVDFFFHFSDFTLNENLYPLKRHSSFYYIVRGVYYFTRSFVYSLIYGNYKYKEINSVKGKILFFCLSLNNRRALSSVMDKFDKQDYHLLLDVDVPELTFKEGSVASLEKPNKKGQMSSLRLSIRRLRSQMRTGEKPG